MDKHTLINHTDIQKWVSSRSGQPGISRIRDSVGMMRAKLVLRFGRDHAAPSETPSQDDGMSPVSWSAWLAELDRQNLALRVSGEKNPRYELIERRELN